MYKSVGAEIGKWSKCTPYTLNDKQLTKMQRGSRSKNINSIKISSTFKWIVVLLLSFERNLRHFHLVTQHWSLHHTPIWWLQSAGCRCCILVRLAKDHHADMIACFLEVNEAMKELLLVFQIFFDQHPQVEYLFSGTPSWAETCWFLFQDLFCSLSSVLFNIFWKR